MSMILSRPFLAVTPTIDGDVLAALARADASFTPPEVHDLIGFHSVAGVRNALMRLTGQGVLHSEQVGRAYTYRLNRQHVCAPPIIGLADASREVLKRMRDLIDTWSTPCDFAALFGSAATGRMTEGSDIDVFVVRPDSVVVEDDVQWHEQLDALATASTSWTGNDARVLEMSASEVADTIATERILAEIARDGFVLSGTPGYLASVKPRPDYRQAG